MTPFAVHAGDCLDVLPTLPPQSVDAVVTDPPYACVDRNYGYWTEEEWASLMHAVVRECRRVLKPQGSAVFIVQPNSEKVGKLRTWAFDFLTWCAREWNVVQDAYWWNHATLPAVGCSRAHGLMRPSVKLCVWCGETNCYRDQGSVLWDESASCVAERVSQRSRISTFPSGHSVNSLRINSASAERGGVTPYNLHPFANTDSQASAGADGHGAGTPEPLCAWWVRYLCPLDGLVCDPFARTSTVGVASLKQGRQFLGIERVPEYVEVSRRRLEEVTHDFGVSGARREARGQMPLLEVA